MPRAPIDEQSVSPAPLPGARLTGVPSPDVYGSGAADVATKTAAHLYAIEQHKAYLEQQAMAHAVTAQATQDYVQATEQATEEAFQNNPTRPDLAKAQAYASWKREQERVVNRYAGKNEGLGALITTTIAKHNTIRTPQLETRTTKAIIETAKAGAQAQADQAAQNVINADTPVEQQIWIEEANQAFTGLRGNALSDQEVHDGMQQASIRMITGLAQKQEAAMPLTTLARVSGFTLDSPALATLPAHERLLAIAERQKANEGALAVRIEKSKDVLDADLDVAVATGGISPAGYLKLYEQRGKQKEVALRKLAVANQLTEEELAKERLGPEAYGNVLGVIHSTQDRIRLDLQRQEKEQEKQTKEQEGQLINSAYQRLNEGKLTTAELDELMNMGTFTEHRDEYRGLLNGLQAQAKAGGVGDVALSERMQRALYMGVSYSKAQLADPRLNWEQQKANFELAEKQQARARADHWSRQPEVQVQYQVLDRKHHISNSLFSENPPPRVANVQKMWTDLMDAAAKGKEPLGVAAERIVKQIDAAFPVQEGWRDLPQPTHPGLVPFLKSVTDPKAKTKLTAPQAHAAILLMVQKGQLNLDDPAVREQVGRLIDILDVLPAPTEGK